MIPAELSRCIGWRGKVYGPGSAQIPDDLALAIGVTADEGQVIPQEAPASPPPNPPISPRPPTADPKKLRSQELSDIYKADGYRPIKELSQRYGLGGTAPDGGWDEAIPLIVEYETTHDLL